MKKKKELAKPNYYIYTFANISIKSDVPIYNEQVTQICDIVAEVLKSKSSPKPGCEIAERIVKEVGQPIYKADFSYDNKTGKSMVELSDNPID